MENYIDYLIEKAFSDGYEYAQKEFNSKAQKERRKVYDTIIGKDTGEFKRKGSTKGYLEYLESKGKKPNYKDELAYAKHMGRIKADSYGNHVDLDKKTREIIYPHPIHDLINENASGYGLSYDKKKDDFGITARKIKLAREVSGNKSVNDKIDRLISYENHKAKSRIIREDHPIGSAIHDAKRWIKKNPNYTKLGLGASALAATGATAYGAKKAYDKYKKSKEEKENKEDK